MKNFKTIHLFSFILLGLLAVGMTSCGEIVVNTDAAKDAVEGAAKDASEAITDAARGAKKAVSDALSPGDEGFDPAIHHGMPEVDQSIVTHTVERSADYLDFAHFGHYDLAHMELKDSSEKSEGEAETKTKIYSDDRNTIEITETVRGEHGYTHIQIVKNKDGEVIKKRTFDFETKPSLKVVERIEDLEAGHIWSREDAMEEHYSKANAHPFSISHEVPWKDTPIKG